MTARAPFCAGFYATLGFCATLFIMLHPMRAQEACTDDAAFMDETGQPCSFWIQMAPAGWDCSNAQEMHYYSSDGETALLESCPVACGSCDTAVDCVGVWSQCAADCTHANTTYSVTVAARSGGAACQFSDGAAGACLPGGGDCAAAPAPGWTIFFELCLFGMQVGAMLAAHAHYRERVERGDYNQPDDPNDIVDVDNLVRLRGNASGAISSLERILSVHLTCSWIVGLVPLFGWIFGVPVVLLCYLAYLPAYRTRSRAGLRTYVFFQNIGLGFWFIVLLWLSIATLSRTMSSCDHPDEDEATLVHLACETGYRLLFILVAGACLTNIWVCGSGLGKTLAALRLPPIDAAAYTRLTAVGSGRDRTLALYQTEAAAAALVTRDGGAAAAQAVAANVLMPQNARAYRCIARATVNSVQPNGPVVRFLLPGETVVVMETRMFDDHYRGRITWTDELGQENTGWVSIRTQPVVSAIFDSDSRLATWTTRIAIAVFVFEIGLFVFLLVWDWSMHGWSMHGWSVLVWLCGLLLLCGLMVVRLCVCVCSCMCRAGRAADSVIDSRQLLVPVVYPRQLAPLPITGQVESWRVEQPQAAPQPRQGRGQAQASSLAQVSDDMWRAFFSQCIEVAIAAMQSGELQPEEVLDREVRRRLLPSCPTNNAISRFRSKLACSGGRCSFSSACRLALCSRLACVRSSN